MRSAFPSRARLVRLEIPFPAALVVRAIPGEPSLKVGDVYPNPGQDKRKRMRAALYIAQRRLVSAPVLTPEKESDAVKPAKTKAKEKKNGLREI